MSSEIQLAFNFSNPTNPTSPLNPVNPLSPFNPANPIFDSDENDTNTETVVGVVQEQQQDIKEDIGFGITIFFCVVIIIVAMIGIINICGEKK